MSFCHVANRNRRNENSVRYLNDTAQKLRRSLQVWIRNLLDTPWMYVRPIREAIEDDSLYFPLGLIEINHQGIFKKFLFKKKTNIHFPLE